jgi:hypothetical protein
LHHHFNLLLTKCCLLLFGERGLLHFLNCRRLLHWSWGWGRLGFRCSLEVVRFHLAAVGHREPLNTVTEVVPLLTFLKLAQLHRDEIDQQHDLRLGHVDLLVQGFAKAHDFIWSGVVFNFKQDLILGESEADILVFVVTFEWKVEEDEIWLGDELGL